MRRCSRALSAAVAALALLAAPACGGDDAEDAAPTTSEVALSGTVTVLAAASLTDAFTELGAAFEAAHPGVEVTFNFGASSSLREQVLAGAPADVYASADRSNVDQVIAAGAATEAEVVATNRLAIAVPDGNPAGITGLGDFTRDELLLGLCAPAVPCGRFGREALAKAGVTPAVDTEAPDVRALLTQVASGDLDAGIVYATDVDGAEDVEGVAIPDDLNVEAVYPLTVLDDAPNPTAATAFAAFVASAEGQAILARHGFGAP